MSARVTWSGLAELREQLRNLPADLTEDARDIVQAQIPERLAELLRRLAEAETRPERHASCCQH